MDYDFNYFTEILFDAELITLSGISLLSAFCLGLTSCCLLTGLVNLGYYNGQSTLEQRMQEQSKQGFNYLLGGACIISLVTFMVNLINTHYGGYHPTVVIITTIIFFIISIYVVIKLSKKQVHATNKSM
jgi:predicted membrane protein